MKRVLFADNDAHFLRTRAGFLEEAGYDITPATTLARAKDLLNSGQIHLAILDLRLVDDRDERDKTGLELAKEEAFRHIPKIILTKFPTYEDVREALGPALDGLPSAVRFVAKQEGPEALIRAVTEAFERYVKVNLDLIIQPGMRNLITFPFLVALVEPDAKSETLLQRSDALEALFRHLFHEYGQIRLNQVLWQREGRVALAVDAFHEGGPRDSFVVVCGDRAQVLRELTCYRDFAPTTSRNLGLARSNETPSFAANAYVLGGTNLEEVRTLGDAYRTGPEKSFSAMLSSLFHSTLAEWHEEKLILHEDESIEELYRARLGLNERDSPRKSFEQRFRAIMRQTTTIGPRIEGISEGLAIRFGGLSYAYPDPTPTIYRTSTVGQPLLTMKTSGTLTGDNILVDASGKTWLTDFADAGLAPVLWNHVQLEAAIRFDWVECNKLQWLHEMERCLIQEEFSRLNVGDVEPPLRKPLRAIQSIRRLALPFLGNDQLPYHIGVFFLAVKRIAEFNPEFQVTPSEIARLGHVLLASSMLAGRIGRGEQESAEPLAVEESSLRIDKANRAVWLHGRRLLLSQQNYELLSALYEKPNQLLTRSELGVRIFGDRYDGSDTSDINKLNQAIFRLREKIEYDPKHPRFLITEPAGGYRLITQE